MYSSTQRFLKGKEEDTGTVVYDDEECKGSNENFTKEASQDFSPSQTGTRGRGGSVGTPDSPPRDGEEP